MRTCENCKKVFQDDMNFCPYCGEKYHDYKDDLKKAMDHLFEEETKEEIVEEKKIVSRVQKQTRIREEKENDVINKILIAVIILIVVALLGGIVLIGKDLLPSPTKTEQPALENPSEDESDEDNLNIDDETNNSQDETTQDENNQDEITQDTPVDNSEGVIDVTNVEDGDFVVDKIKVKKEGDQARLEVECSALMAGNIFLNDTGTLNVGPINVSEGKNEFYFIVSGNADYTLSFDASNGRTYEYSITSEMIQKALKN